MMRTSRLLVLAVLSALPIAAVAGNGAPSGSHYNLNLLGKAQCSPSDLTGSNRHTIQVLLNFDDGNQNNTLFTSLDRRNKIFLGASADGTFRVTDGNACDRGGASFELPATVATDWTIWVRELGKPGGTGSLNLCGVDDLGTVDPADDIVYCNTDPDYIVSLERSKGKSTFRDVTRQLTTISCVDLDQDPLTPCESVSLFDNDLYSYFWDFDNNGLRLVQLRFYPN